MRKDPFMILGVSDNVTQNELYEAYRTERAKYESKRFELGEEGTKACEKLDEIESAYREADEILKSRYVIEDAPTSSKIDVEEDFPTLGRVDELVKQKRYAEAQAVLNRISYRDAEWNFLQSIVFYAQGRTRDAEYYLRTAVEMDPANAKYKDAYSRMVNRATTNPHDSYYANNDDRSYRNSNVDYGTQRGAMSPCDCCQGLICADCCCECMGGDLISCC